MKPDTMSWAKARAVAGETGPLPSATVPLDQALGLVLAGDLRAPAGMPAADISAMDGFATCGRGPWRVTGHLLAGQVHPVALRAGEAVEIATGAAVPPGTDTVLRYEDAGRSSHGAVTGRHEPERNIRRAGSDFAAGQILARSGTRLTALMLGLAASAGCDEVQVRPRPRARVVLTGAEVGTSGRPSAHLTRDALGPAMTGLLSSLGAQPVGADYPGDSEEALAGALARDDADLLVVTGGSAAGPADRLRKVLADAGADLLVDGVRCRPGHPQFLAYLPAVTVPCPAGAARRPGYTLLRPVRLDPRQGLQLLPPSSPASLLAVAQASHLLAVGDEDMAVLVPLPTGLCP